MDISKIKRAAVIGAGAMGSGIAHVFVLGGIDVSLIEANAALVKKAVLGISANMDRQVKKGIIDAAAKEKALSKIKTATSLDEAKNAPIIVEAVPENLTLKKEIFTKLDSLCDSRTIFATNTSSISITTLAACVRNPERVIGMHFMNPVPVMKLVELIRGLQTSDETYETARGLTLELGKVPVTSNDFPGFISNRILMPLINEACFALMEGVASKEDIDTVMKLGMNHPMGPLELADFIGLDVCLDILNVLLEGFGDPKYRPCPLLKRMVNAGRLGQRLARDFMTISNLEPGELSEAQIMARDSARDFAEKRLKPLAQEMDEKEEIPQELYREAAQLGLFGMMIPEKYDGLGLDYLAYALAMEEISRACAAFQVGLTVHNSLVCSAILKFGTEEQREKYLPKAAVGEWIGAYSLSEPGAGTDAGSLRTTAVLDGGFYIINGVKAWVTNAGRADFFLVFVLTDPKLQKKGISCLIVDKNTPGISIGKKKKKLGIRASGTHEIRFSNCRIPSANLLGEENHGLKIALTQLNSGRIAIAAQALGIARAAFEEAIKYAKAREQFGRPIADFQATQFKIADMAVGIEASRLLICQAARLMIAGKPCAKEASIAKLFASQHANKTAFEALQIHGGNGYIREFPVERYFRDARVTEIYEGTSEIQRLIIAREILTAQGV